MMSVTVKFSFFFHFLITSDIVDDLLCDQQENKRFGKDQLKRTIIPDGLL